TETAGSQPERGEAARRSRARERGAWLAATLAVAGLSAFLVRRLLTEATEPRPPTHFVLDTPEGLTFPELGPVAMSPDRRHIAFAASSPDGDRIWIRSLDAPDPRVLAGTSGAAGGGLWCPPHPRPRVAPG